MGSCCTKETPKVNSSVPPSSSGDITEPIYTADSDDEEGVVKNPIVPDMSKAYSPPPAVEPVATTSTTISSSSEAPPQPADSINSEASPRRKSHAVQRRRSTISTNGKDVLSVVEVDMAPLSTAGKFRANVVAEVNYSQCVDKMTPTLTGESLLTPMTDAEVYRRGWAEKRGHMVKNWKKRWFVVDETEIRYYVKERESAPFGADLKGQVGLAFGSIDATVEKNDKGEDIEVMVVRNSDKDLYMTFDDSDEADSWTRSINEAIRRASVAALAAGALELLGAVNISLQPGETDRVSLGGGVGRASGVGDTASASGAALTYRGEEWFAAQRLAYEQTLLGAYFSQRTTRKAFRCRKHGFSADSKRSTVAVDMSFYFSHVEHEHPPSNTADYGRVLADCPAECAGIAWTLITATGTPASSSAGKLSFADITDLISGSNSNGVLESEATLSVVAGKLSFSVEFSAEGVGNAQKAVFRDFTEKLVDILRYCVMIQKVNHFTTGLVPNPKAKKSMVIAAQVSR